MGPGPNWGKQCGIPPLLSKNYTVSILVGQTPDVLWHMVSIQPDGFLPIEHCIWSNKQQVLAIRDFERSNACSEQIDLGLASCITCYTLVGTKVKKN
jgi:hypothetical protein